MTIAFACPNGHPLTAPENLAGKPGQCPRCNTRFLIPTLEEVAAAAGDSAGGEPASEASSAAVSNAPPSPPAPPPPKSPAPASAVPPSAGAPAAVGSLGAVTSASGGPAAFVSSAANSPPPAKAAGKASGPDTPAAAAPPGTMVFFCPNGHRLNGPTSLRGKLGQCPHCQTKFRIPADEGVTADPRWQGSPEPQAPPRREESSADAGAAPPVAAGSSSSVATAAPPPARPSAAPTAAPPSREEDSSSMPSGELVDEESAPESSDSAGADDDVPLVEPLQAWQYPPPPPGDGNRLADLVTWLWTQRDANSYVELRLKDGELFAPTWFAPDVSQQHCAVFATQHDDNRFSIRLILWENIVEVNVRQLDEIPLDLFV